MRLLALAIFLFISTATLSFSCPTPQTEEMTVIDLESAIELALNRNKTLLGATYSLASAEVIKEVAASAFDLKFVPKGETGYIGGGKAGSGLTVGGGFDLEKKLPFGTQITLGPSILKDAKKYHSNLRVKVSQPLLRGFGESYNRSGIKGAEFGYRTASRSLCRTMAFTVMRTIESIYEIKKQKEMLELDRESHERLQRFVKMTKIKERIGMSDSLDVYRAQIELKQSEENLQYAEERIQDAKDILRDLLDLPLNLPIEVTAPTDFIEVNLDYDTAVNTALEHRTELAQVWDQLCESRRLMKVAKRNMLPELNFVVDYTNQAYDETFTGSFGRKRDSRWGFGFTTSGNTDPVHSRGSYQESAIALENAERVCFDTKNIIILEVKKVLRNVAQTAKKITLQEEQKKNVEGQMMLAKLKFSRGMANNFDLLQAERALRASQGALYCALIDHKVGEYKLLLTMGVLLDKQEWVHEED